MPLTETTRSEMREIIARYPKPRSALLPMLHLVQSVEGYVTPEGIEMCAEELDLTTAEVTAVATFYTMYKRRPTGKHHVGVCTNTLCAVMGGDAVFSAVKEHLGVGNDETTADGEFTVEHIECQAACDYAPVMTVDWEFFDKVTPSAAVQVLDDLKAGREVTATRGPKIESFRATERVLAGFVDGKADQGPPAGEESLLGLRLAKQFGDAAPTAGSAPAADAASQAAEATEQQRELRPSASDAPAQTAESDPANPAHAGQEDA
jgi:NADH-quinone oxidoreductase subunit E